MRPLRFRERTARPSVLASTLSVLAATLVMLLAVSTGPASAAQRSRSGTIVVQPTQALATLLGSHAAMSAPDELSTTLEQVRARRPITEERTVLPVIGQTSDADGIVWLHVLLPGRPNGHTGWIRQRATRAALTSWHIVVDTSERRVTIYQRGRRMRVFRAVVGRPATPTPRGEFFVEEVIQLRARDVGAPFALALSARSNVLQQFAGGPGQIGLHGLKNVGGTLGSAASHGCVRLSNGAMRWLVIRIGPGVPVTIKN
jgi:lipoprotein-anchoring transpeptidase ErfK/SrfK